MAEYTRKKNKVAFEKEITTDEPNASATLKLEVYGLTEEAVEKLRIEFIKLWNDVEQLVEKETSLTIG